MSNKSTKVFGRLNPIDFAILVIFFVAVIGFLMAKAGYAGVNKVIQGISKVDIDVYLVGLKTTDTELFKVGENSAITIRNQPVYPPMKIVGVKHWPKQLTFLGPDGKKLLTFPDPTQTVAHDFLVTVADEAEVTADGYVIRGNKIKIGNQIELEGFKYRVQGVVVDIRAHQ